MIDNEIQKLYQQHQKSLLINLDSISASLSPESVIQKALLGSIDTNTSRTKQRWVKCYKVVNNINRYIKEEILYQQAQITSLKDQIQNKRNLMITQLTNKIKQIHLKISQEALNNPEKKDISYYEKQFNIVLVTYKIPQHKKFVKQIILTMKGQMDSYFSFDFKQITEKINNKMIQLRTVSDKYLQDKIEPMVIGCKSKCPACGMKCKKSSNHPGSHQVLQNTHLMECFNGIYYIFTGFPFKSCCYTHERVQNGYINHAGTTYKVIDWIKNCYPDWYQHFNKGPYSTIARENECNIIWAHIGDMIIKYRFTHMKNDPSCNIGRQNELNDADMELYKLKNY